MQNRAIPQDDETVKLGFEDIHLVANENLKLTRQDLKREFDTIVKIFDVHSRILTHYLPMTLYGGAFQKQKTGKDLIRDSSIQILYRFYTCVSLTGSGQYGAARIILRQIFEFLVIAKYVIVSGDDKFLKYWEGEGRNINIDKQILNKISIAKVDSLKLFHQDLSEFNHATKRSMSAILPFKHIQKDIEKTFVFIFILQACTHHLISAHFVDSTMKYYKHAYDTNNWKDLQEKTKNVSKLFRIYTPQMGSRGRDVIKTYCRGWKFV